MRNNIYHKFSAYFYHLHAHMHMCMHIYAYVHVHICMPLNIINMLMSPISTYAKNFVKFWVHLAEIWKKIKQKVWHVSSRCACTCTYAQAHMHAANIFNLLQRPILAYAESLVKNRLKLAEIFGFKLGKYLTAKGLKIVSFKSRWNSSES